MNYDITFDEAVKINKELRDFCLTVFQAHGLVAGKAKSGYGDSYSFKIEAYANEGVTKELCSKIHLAIIKHAEKLYAQNNLVNNKSTAKYGYNFSITLKADKLVIGRNGVNLASKYAKNFRMFSYDHKLPDATLGQSAKINDKVMYLAGVEVKKNGDLLPVVWDGSDYRLFKDPKVLQKYWGKQLAEAK